MTRRHEDRLIERAIEILKARKDERAETLAMQLAGDVKIDMRNLYLSCAFYRGYREGFMAGWKELNSFTKSKEDKIYADATFRLVTESMRTAELFRMGYDIGYKNHVRDAKGNLTRCDAYFIKKVTLFTEQK